MLVTPSTHLKIRIGISFLCSLLSFTLSSQGITLNLLSYLNAAPSFVEPPEELGLLPDTPSYHIVEELYNADTLTRKGTTLSYYNIGNSRYCISSTEDMYSRSDEIIQMQRINDTFSLQTTTKLNRYDPGVDSTLVWWKEDLITHAWVIPHKRNRTEYTYTYENKKLVHERLKCSDYPQIDIQYSYLGDRLVKVVSRGNDFGWSENEYIYSDSLITVNSTEHGDSTVSHVKSLTRLDTDGRQLSVNTYMQLSNEPEFRLFQSEEYIYYGDGGYQMTAVQYSQYNQPYVSVLEYHPGYFCTERWTWSGSDQVWRKRYMKF